jgi:peptidoglycan hydrolase-like protein with peptidoglycan-binding domain
MIRTFALVSALVAASLSTQALSAQSSATKTQQPAASPTAKKAPVVHAQADTSAKAGPTAMKTHHAAWTKDQIKEAQEGLAKAGLYKGKVTGVFNKDTKKALRAYQKENKLPVTGRLSDSVLVKLKSA